MDDTTPHNSSPATNRPQTALPLFPLDTVLLPGAHLPLYVFEPRYRQLVVDLMNAAESDQQFGIVTTKAPAGAEVTSHEQVHPIGCSTRLREVQRMSDGQLDVVTTGQRRFRLLHIDSESAPYLIGTVEWIDDDPVPEPVRHAAERLAGLARDAHRKYCDFAWNGEWTEPPEDTDLATLAYVLAADCLLPHTDRQRLLAETHPLRRLRIARDALTREKGLLSRLRAVPAPASHLLDIHGQASLN